MGRSHKYLQMGYVPVVFSSCFVSFALLILGLNAGEKGRGRYFLDTTKEVGALLKPAFLSPFP